MSAPTLTESMLAMLQLSDSWTEYVWVVVCACSLGLALGWHLSRALIVPFDADRYIAMTDPEEKVLRGALAMAERIRDHTTRCYFKGRLREMVRLQPICDEVEFAKMSKDLHAEVDDCLHFGTCFRHAGPAVKWDISRLPKGPLSIVAGVEVVMDITRIHRVLVKLSRRYGKVFPMQLEGNPLWVVVSGAKEAKAIFHDHGATMSSRSFGQAHLITHTDFPAGNFLRCPFSEDLKKRRKVVWSEALSKQKVELFRPILDRCRHISVRAFLLAAEKGVPFNPRTYLRMAYCNTLACILFGIFFTDVEDPEFKRVYEFVDDEANEPLAGEADIFPALRHTLVYSRKAGRMKKVRARQDAWLQEQIQARQRHLAGGADPQTLCDLMLNTMSSPCPGQRLSYENVKEMCNEIIFAGTDTTATTTETVLAHLLNNPSKAELLRAELDGLFGESQRMPGPEDFEKLKYTNAAIKEAMRMTCAVPFNSHTCTADTEVLGYRIPKGAMVINNIYAVHYDPEIYPDPENYLPERWLDKNPSQWAVENDFEFMPFGIGRRLCLGYNLALENLQLFVSSLFWSFEFSSATGKPVSMKEHSDFTVSVPAFKVLASVRESTLLGRELDHFRALPSMQLAKLGGSVPDCVVAAQSAAISPHMATSSEKWAIWYGSQTGTSEGFSHVLACLAARHGVQCSVRNLETARDASAVELCPGDESKAIFIVSTFGNGEPSDSAADFFERLSVAQTAAVGGLPFAVFGLGNSSYEHYNGAAKRLDKRLEELGGLRLQGVSLGLGDASKDIDGPFDEWAGALVDAHAPVVTESIGKSGTSSSQSAPTTSPSSSWKVLWHPEIKEKQKVMPASRFLKQRKTRISELARTSTIGKIQSIKELSKQPGVSGSIVEITLDLGEATYETADTIGIFPSNDSECVELFGALLNQPLDTAFALAPSSEDAALELPCACPTTLREVLSTTVDIVGKPSRRLVAELARFCGDAVDREVLAHLSSAAGKAEWEELAQQGRLSLLELFFRHRSLASVPLANFLELAPQMRLKPRYYTASSSPATLGSTFVTLTVKVVRDRVFELNNKGSALGGVSSAFLASALAGDPVRLFVQPSAFALPSDSEVPVVMVATGTGLAPFRGFLQERKTLADAGSKLGEATLFFGCTHSDVDFLCEGELTEHLRTGVLTQIVTAFSRQDPQKKVYVQHRIVEHSAVVLSAVHERKGNFYVCGGTAMGRAAKDALVSVLATRLQQAEAEAYVTEMEKDGRLIQELWA